MFPKIRVELVGLILSRGAAAARIAAIVVCGNTTIWVEAVSVVTVRDQQLYVSKGREERAAVREGMEGAQGRPRGGEDSDIAREGERGMRVSGEGCHSVEAGWCSKERAFGTEEEGGGG